MTQARERVLGLLAGARRLLDTDDSLGQRTRREIAATTGLSPRGVEWGLCHCLEVNATPAEIDGLLAHSPQAPRSLVLLSANVFSAALRAIALALAASPDVVVRPSRREPAFARLLAEAVPGAFTVVDELRPMAGDLLWLYGSDATVNEVQMGLAPGVILKSFGDGFGVVVAREQDLADAPAATWSAFADAVALDASLFEGRGCLSPRLVLAEGAPEFIQRLCEALLTGFERVATLIPRGALASEELAEISWYRECIACLGEWRETAAGAVARVEGRVEPLPPPGRVLQVCALGTQVNTVNSEGGSHVNSVNILETVAALAPWLTSVAYVAGSEAGFVAALGTAAPQARLCPAGQMQRPPLDGPVDLRRP